MLSSWLVSIALGIALGAVGCIGFIVARDDRRPKWPRVRIRAIGTLVAVVALNLGGVVLRSMGF